MIGTTEALDVCRAFAALGGEYGLDADNTLAEAVERLLFVYAVAETNLEEARDALRRWGVPARQFEADKIAGQAFERGWNESERDYQQPD